MFVIYYFSEEMVAMLLIWLLQGNQEYRMQIIIS